MVNVHPGGPALVVSGLSFSYPDKPDVLREVSLKVQPGERVGLIGPNGAGKTTFFLVSCGALKPNAGKIVLFGKPMVHGDFRPEIGMVFQNPDDQLFCPSVWDDVAFGPQNLGLSKGEVEARVTEALSMTGMLELADRVPHHLSGGEKRMVSIAGVLAMHPQLLIYDEPTSNLDIRSRRRLIHFLQASQETMLIASHDLEFILEVCDRVVLMDEGRIVVNGEPREVLGDVELMEAHGLERPHSLVPHVELHHTGSS
jgi:cobalt/nickel transport system ATP-binding protein